MSVVYPPTPPFSPQPNHLLPHKEQTPLKTTVNLLDSLIAHYQQERMWVYRTRASLENAFVDTPPAILEPQSDNAFPKVEQDQDGTLSENGNATPVSTHSRWAKRKRDFKMRLELSPKPKRIVSTMGLASPSYAQRSSLPPREHLLDLFEKMMETRMESCERINKLVKNANRAHLHDR